MRIALGAALMIASVLLFWLVSPRHSEERGIVRLPGMWVVLPLLIMLGFLGGGALIFESVGR
jgi:hypothetical protein